MPVPAGITVLLTCPLPAYQSKGRKNWLFVGSEQAGERAAVLMSLIESAKLNGHDAWFYLKDILTKLPTWPNSRLAELLPHRWTPPSSLSRASRRGHKMGLARAYAACLLNTREVQPAPRCVLDAVRSPGLHFGLTVCPSKPVGELENPT